MPQKELAINNVPIFFSVFDFQKHGPKGVTSAQLLEVARSFHLQEADPLAKLLTNQFIALVHSELIQIKSEKKHGIAADDEDDEKSGTEMTGEIGAGIAAQDWTPWIKLLEANHVRVAATGEYDEQRDIIACICLFIIDLEAHHSNHGTIAFLSVSSFYGHHLPGKKVANPKKKDAMEYETAKLVQMNWRSEFSIGFYKMLNESFFVKVNQWVMDGRIMHLGCFELESHDEACAVVFRCSSFQLCNAIGKLSITNVLRCKPLWKTKNVPLYIAFLVKCELLAVTGNQLSKGLKRKAMEPYESALAKQMDEATIERYVDTLLVSSGVNPDGAVIVAAPHSGGSGALERYFGMAPSTPRSSSDAGSGLGSESGPAKVKRSRKKSGAAASIKDDESEAREVIQEQQDKRQMEIEAFEKQQKQKQSEIDALEEQQKQQFIQIDALEGQQRKRQNEINALEAKLLSTQKYVATMEAKNEGLRQRLVDHGFPDEDEPAVLVRSSSSGSAIEHRVAATRLSIPIAFNWLRNLVPINHNSESLGRVRLGAAVMYTHLDFNKNVVSSSRLNKVLLSDDIVIYKQTLVVNDEQINGYAAELVVLEKMRLQSHINIPKVHGLVNMLEPINGEPQRSIAHAIALEFIRGTTMIEHFERLAKDDGTSGSKKLLLMDRPYHTMRIILQLVNGVAHLHKMGIVHRNIHLGNVMITSAGLFKESLDRHAVNDPIVESGSQSSVLSDTDDHELRNVVKANMKIPMVDRWPYLDGLSPAFASAENHMRVSTVEDARVAIIGYRVAFPLFDISKRIQCCTDSDELMKSVGHADNDPLTHTIASGGWSAALSSSDPEEIDKIWRRSDVHAIAMVGMDMVRKVAATRNPESKYQIALKKQIQSYHTTKLKAHEIPSMVDFFMTQKLSAQHFLHGARFIQANDAMRAAMVDQYPGVLPVLQRMTTQSWRSDDDESDTVKTFQSQLDDCRHASLADLSDVLMIENSRAAIDEKIYRHYQIATVAATGASLIDAIVEMQHPSVRVHNSAKALCGAIVEHLNNMADTKAVGPDSDSTTEWKGDGTDSSVAHVSLRKRLANPEPAPPSQHLSRAALLLHVASQKSAVTSGIDTALVDIGKNENWTKERQTIALHCIAAIAKVTVIIIDGRTSGTVNDIAIRRGASRSKEMDSRQLHLIRNNEKEWYWAKASDL